MRILIGNIAWIDNGWTDIDNQTTSGHSHVQEGGIAHESLNFKFDGEWNSSENVYGYCHFTNPPKVEENNNVVVLYSKKKIVGIYMNVEFGEHKPKNIPAGIEYFNLKAHRTNSFTLNEYIEFEADRHLPEDKIKIGQNGFTYIEKEQLLNILNDMIEVNPELDNEIEEIKNNLGIKQNQKKKMEDKMLDRKFWVISPNVRGDNTDSEKYKKIMEDRKCVLMGWRKENHLGKIFNEMPKGDVVLIAGKSNKNKEVFACGLMGSVIEDTEECQARDLKYFVKIPENHNLSFDGCAFGESSQIPAIYRLKPNNNECDKKIIDYILNLIKMEKREQKMKERIKLLEYQKQIILQGPPGTGKTRLAKQMAIYMIEGKIDPKTEPKIDDIKEQVKLIQFHPSYSYEDFVRGIVAKSNGTTIEYKTENKVLAQMAEKAFKDKDNPYILIIDEINRANLSSVLGELIYALEYRGEAVESMYDIGGDREIILPSNLYIIGTMNTADRSVGHIDYAIRRRFAFESILPDSSIVNDNSKFEDVEKLFKNGDGTKADTLFPEFNPDDVMLGHSYFMVDEEELKNKIDEELKNKLIYQVIPLLKEYVKDGVLTESAMDEINKLN